MHLKWHTLGDAKTARDRKPYRYGGSAGCEPHAPTAKQLQS